MAGAPEKTVRHRFDQLAGRYDRRWARYISATTRETLARIDLVDARSVLDVGCGTGSLLEALSRRREGAGLAAARLAGVDLSPAMLAVARSKLGASAILVAADAARLPFRSRTFDLALSASALHYWRDPAAALSEVRRILRPGGRVTVTDWCADAWVNRLRDLVLRRFEPAHFRVYRASDLDAMLAAAGFCDVRVERFQVGRLWGLMTATATRTEDDRSFTISAAP